MKSIINNLLLRKEKCRPPSLLLMMLCGVCFYSDVFALGFGEPVLRSYLGQPLNVQIPITGIVEENLVPSCIQAVVKTIDGDLITTPRADIVASKSTTSPDPTTLINLKTREGISEPAITLSIALKCGSLIEWSYSLLLDYAEQAAPAMSIATADLVEPLKTAPPPQHIEVIEPVAAQRTQPIPRPKRVRPPKKSTKVKTNNRIVKKPINAVSSPKDQLKLSNEETTSVANTNTPTIPVAEKPVVDIEAQRMAENNLAQEHFAAMLREEPSSLTTQAEEAKKAEQQKIQRLEKELELLKLQLQSNSKPAVANSSPLPLILMVTNAVVLVLLVVLLIIVGKLWLSLRKASTPSGPLWWDSLSEIKQKTEVPKVDTQEKEDDSASEALTASRDTVVPATSVQQADEQVHQKDEVNTENNNDRFNLFTSRRGPSVQIEELSDCAQEAEFWVSINNPRRAIAILEPQSLDENLAMPVSSLYLLDLYRLVGDQEKYNELSNRLRHKFNIAIPQFDEIVDQSQLKSLEDYEHIMQRCCAFWNTNYILPYLESLLIDNREGVRAGFDLPVYRDILFLISICKELDHTKDLSVPSSNQ